GSRVMPAEEAMRTVVVLSGGPPDVDGAARAWVAAASPQFVVAADAGAHLAALLDLRVDVLVGDMDSLQPDHLAAAERSGAQVLHYPTDKDATDLELALDVAVTESPTRILVVGSGSGRLDHLLGSVAVLASERWAAMQVDAQLGGTRLHVVRGRRFFDGTPGETVSLLAHGGPATGVTTEGLRWALSDATLRAGSGLGVSNELVDPTAVVDVADGCVIVVRPGSTS
ncbi:MAG: thiamine diphosphokinase, partial [Actinomycetes bacterium]